MPGSPKFDPHFAEWGKDECGVQLFWASMLHDASTVLRYLEEFVAGGLAVEARLEMAIRTYGSLSLRHLRTWVVR